MIGNMIVIKETKFFYFFFISLYSLLWAGHVIRRPVEAPINMVFKSGFVDDKRSRGRPKNSVAQQGCLSPGAKSGFQGPLIKRSSFTNFFSRPFVWDFLIFLVVARGKCPACPPCYATERTHGKKLSIETVLHLVLEIGRPKPVIELVIGDN